MRNTLYPLFMFVMFLCIIGMLGFIYLSISEKNPLTYQNAPFVLPRTEYKAGESITFPVTRCSTKDITYSSAQKFIRLDTVGTTTPYNAQSSSGPIRKGCETLQSSPKLIPDLPPGVYELSFDIAVRGAFRDFVLSVYTVPFKVVGTSTKINK